MRSRILVIGGLAAGPAAASKAKRTQPDAEVILFEQGEHISSGICEVPYYISNVIKDRDQLSILTPHEFERTRGVKVHVWHRVEEILPVKKKIVVRDLYKEKMHEYEYDKLILATGSKGKPLGVQGENGRNVFRIKSLADGLALKKYIQQESPQNAVIIGGGYVGMEMCEALGSLGLATTLLCKNELPMSRLEKESQQLIRDELKNNKINIMAPSTIKSMISDQTGKIIEVVTHTGTFPTDLVIIAIGVEPGTELARAIRVHLGASGVILTDQRQLTSIDSLYAAGDCCEVKNLINNKWMYAPLATYAARQGWTAGENAAGGNAMFKGAIRSVAVKIFGLEVASVGLSTQEAEESGMQPVSESIVGDSRISFYPGNEKVCITLIADKRNKQLLGANVVGGAGSALRANVLGTAVQQKMNVDEVQKLDLLYSPPFSPLWDPLLIAAHQLGKRLDTYHR
jgi:NADPH-dependent 2,4-dienoyl-CoA reductase/sulfur reductase-like enzyme